MTKTHALVVDDSRSARMILRKMLEKYDVDVATAESAEAAIDYLLNRQPDVIFMDHMMPGMDGFQAVKAIKSNPRTATIPIMMYTSKEGEVYVGEARALGAVGVLPKEVKHADLVRVLENLHLLPHQRLATEPLRAANAEDMSAPTAGVVDAEVAALAREVAEDAIQQFLGTQLEDLRSKLRQDLRSELTALHEAEADAAESPPYRRWPAAATAMAVVASLIVAYWAGRQQHQPTAAGLTDAAPVAVEPAAAQPATLLPDAGDAALKPARQSADIEKRQLLQTLEWALNQSAQVDYDQIPFGEERLASLNELLSRLAMIGFEGTVRLDSHTGRFCVVHTGSGDLRPAEAELPIGECTFIGQGTEQSLVASGRQSLAFANFLSSSPLLRSGKIRVELVPHGEDNPRYEYPFYAPSTTAGQWNAIAQRNNRVEVSIIPASR